MFTWAEVHAFSHPLTSEPPPDNLQPRYNIAPTQEVLIVRLSAHGRREAVRLRWGLVPSWAKDTTRAARCINARAETVDTLPTFRDAFMKRRCLVLASGFYEWRKVSAKEKQPHYITARDDKPMAFAGLWERWTPKDGGQPVETFAIITTAANALLSPLHDRMPAILDEAKQTIWLGEKNAAPPELKAMLRPYPPERMQQWPVDKQVGNVKNDDPALIERTSNLL
jgi:putative SOS response-associated peptidase YedK